MAIAQPNNSTVYEGTKRRLRIWLFVVVMFMGWAVYTLFAQLGKQEQAELKLTDIEQKIAVATKQISNLKLQVDRLNDPEYILQIARREQNYVLPGEQPISIQE